MRQFKPKKYQLSLFSSQRRSAWSQVYSKSFGRRRSSLFRKHTIPQKYWLPILIVLFLISGSIIFISHFYYSFPYKDLEKKPVGAKPQGFCFSDSTSNIFAILIDNEIHSRPSVGLSKADLVYEAPTEAGITRFLAVFCQIPHSTSPFTKGGGEEGDFDIGPIRSLRPYFLEWAEELRAPIVHVGGSPEALEKVKNSDIPDLDQYYNGKYFWRSSDRIAPHNVFTNIKKLSEFLKDKFPVFESKREVWKYKMDFADGLPPADYTDNLSAQSAASVSAQSISEISIDYLRPEHLVKWVYDKNTNSYLRYQNGVEHLDADGSRISAKNIIIQTTDITILDAVGRRKIRTTGKGKAMIFLDGKMIRAIWQKQDKDSLTRFYFEPGGMQSNSESNVVQNYDLLGQEIKLNPGKIWIEVISDKHKVSVSS